jgi:hypothetical protein
MIYADNLLVITAAEVYKIPMSVLTAYVMQFD